MDVDLCYDSEPLVLPEPSTNEVKVDRGHDPTEYRKHMAMAALGLLRMEKKKALHQIKHMVKLNKELACLVLTTDVEGWTPVHACALRGSKKLFKMMLLSGIDVNSVMGQPEGLPARCTLLHVATKRKDKKVVQYLLNHGANICVRDSEGQTPLSYARAGGNKEAVKLLLECGAGMFEPPPIHLRHPHLNHSGQLSDHELSAAAMRQRNFDPEHADLHPKGHRRRASTDLSSTSRGGVLGLLVNRLAPRPVHWAASSPNLTNHEPVFNWSAGDLDPKTSPSDLDSRTSSRDLDPKPDSRDLDPISDSCDLDVEIRQSAPASFTANCNARSDASKDAICDNNNGHNNSPRKAKAVSAYNL